MDEDDVAMDFFRSLDNSRYSAFKTNLVNNINSGAIEQPESLNEMYTQAAAYLIPTRHQHAGTHKTAFATTADKSFRDEDRRGGRGGRGGSRGEKGGRGGSRGRRRESRSDENEKSAEKPQNPHEGRDCWGCGEKGHLLRDCPEVEADGGEEVKGGAVNMTIRFGNFGSDSDSEYDSDDSESTAGAPALVSDSESEYDSDDSDSTGAPALVSDSESEYDSDDFSGWDSDDHSECDGDWECRTKDDNVKHVAYLTAPKTTEWYEVLLDNQANTSVIHPRLLCNIRRSVPRVPPRWAASRGTRSTSTLWATSRGSLTRWHTTRAPPTSSAWLMLKTCTTLPTRQDIQSRCI